MILAFAVASARGATDVSKEIEVVAGGKSPYVIVVPDQADQERIMQAANLLQKTIQESSGAKLPVVKESEMPKGAPAIYLGKSAAAKKAGLPMEKVTGWAYLNKTVNRDIFLVGDDGVDDIKEEKIVIDHLGTLKAATAFLEGQLGVRFLLPGEYGTHVPKLDRLTVDAGMNKFWEPCFDYVIGRAPPDRINAVALNLFGRTPILKPYGGHSYYTAVPEKEYGEKHPEYFALIGGIRTPKGNHLCISNPEVQELMLKEMGKRLDLGYQWVELAQTDAYQPCQCEKCAALHLDIGERIWIVHRKLAEEMKKRRPGKKVLILSYGPTVTPPRTFRSFPDNVMIQMCVYNPEMFEAWAPFNVDKTIYSYNWGQYHVPGYGPKRTPRYVIDQVRLFLKNHVRGIYLDGGFTGGQGAYGLDGPSYYAYGKALDNPDTDPKNLLEEYVNAAFGESATPMRAFFRAMNDRLETYSLFYRPNVPVGQLPNSFSSPEDYYCHCFPAKLLNDMSLNLKRAQNLARDEKVKARLQLVEIEFRYVKNLATIYQTYRAYRAEPNRAVFDQLAKQVEERKKMIDSFYPGGQPMQIKGLPSPFMGADKAWVEMGGRGAGFVGNRPPLNWDFALMREKGILPGTGETKRVEVRRVREIALDGRLDKPAWQDIPFQEMSEIGLGKPDHSSRFKVLYDEQAVYIGVECQVGNFEWLDELKPVGRDGNATGQECIEIVIDPYGEREKHCQFSFNPVPDSTYDARYDYITDPVHPLYGKRDASWNGEWQYAARIDREGKRWTAEVRIPFKTLEAEPAKTGTVWTMNVCRTEYPKGRGTGPAPVYSTWSPNLESRSFHERASYGDVIFR